MVYIPRQVRIINNDLEAQSSKYHVRGLEEFRKQAAWVLLGEPGAGKSSAFEAEAKANGGVFISIAKFLSGHPDPEWHGKTLFLDGLDEVRASRGDDSILLKVARQLRMLNKPPFRIACRAADWRGSTDRDDISDVSPDSQLTVLGLEPLGPSEILTILSENHPSIDPERFIKQARNHRVEGLLSNPQTLSLLIISIGGGEWPTSRQQTYELACQQLGKESSKRHRDQRRDQPITANEILDAAGHLCAVLLLSDKSGLALDAESSDERFPFIENFSPPDLTVAYQAVGRKLFRTSPEGEQKCIPTHRSIAEYLAAKWLAHHVDSRALPLGRLLNLLFGTDGRTVAGLRGLYGWLALQCKTARAQLIRSDPITVVLYGDVKPMPTIDKRSILDGLKREAKQCSAFHLEAGSENPFGALADAELISDYIAALESPDRSEAAQSFVNIVLKIIREGEKLAGLSPSLMNVVIDDSRWSEARATALESWLNLDKSEDALALLETITQGHVTDCDDELAGRLLRSLYPGTIKPEHLLRYLHSPKDPDLSGRFIYFWAYELPKITPDTHLPVLLDPLAAHTRISWEGRSEFHLRQMIGGLLAKGVELHGDNIDDERLYSWLGIGMDIHTQSRRERKDSDLIAGWLTKHPARYKSLMSLCYSKCKAELNVASCIYHQKKRLHNAIEPADIGLWHLAQASNTTNDSLAKQHLIEAVDALMYQRGAEGMRLEDLEAWGNAHPQRKHWMESLLTWEVDKWHTEDAAHKKITQQKHNNQRRQHAIDIARYRTTIKAGTANAGLMHDLAGVWLNHYSNAHGDSLIERFENYCEDGTSALQTAEAGFRRCPWRTDIPSVTDIINTNIKGKEHFIRKPCLVGMELCWQDGVDLFHLLPENNIRCMMAFCLTYGVENTPEWFSYFARRMPVWVAEVLIEYSGKALAAKRDHIEGIYAITHDVNFSDVAKIAIPRVLQHFPLRAKTSQFSMLTLLLKAALQYSQEQLPALLENKIAMKSMDVAQKVHWLTAAMLFDPKKYEDVLWEYVGNSWHRANYIASFLGEHNSNLKGEHELSARSLGNMIELLAPNAEVVWPRGGGWVNDAMRRGNQIRAMITQLGNQATECAAREIERLLNLPSSKKLTLLLENSRHQLRIKQRENTFRFPSLPAVARILANSQPANAADLTALTLDHLDDYASEIHKENTDLFRQFWTESTKDNKPKLENSCRDVILEKLRIRLKSFGVDCQPEADHVNDKRADICLSFDNKIRLPIEIKGDWNKTLWTALHRQLIAQYSIEPKTEGYGIYLVLWFGGENQPAAIDGGKKPRLPKELQDRLESLLDPEERKRIFVRVLDVGWPN